jgi:glycolate oxidase FAD binding subunit
VTQADDGASQAANPASLEDALTAADVEWRALGPEEDRYLVGGVRPSYLCSPGNVDELAAAVRAASVTDAAVIPWGGGTRMSIGFPPRAADLIVETGRLAEIVEYEPADLTVTVQAGMILADLQARLRAEGQMLALDPAASDRATIGGLIATNASGPLRLLYGTARDLVIGTRVVNGDGIVSKAGGRVVKNVAGYDLNKLYVGSLGTVGVIVELSFKLHPLPQNEGMLLASFDSVDDAAGAISTLMRSPLGPAAVELLDAGAAAGLSGAPSVSENGVLLIVAATGFERAVQRQLGDVKELSTRATEAVAVREAETVAGLWSALRELADPSAVDIALLKLAVPPSRSAVTLQTARDTAREAGFAPVTQAHAGSGVVYLKLQADTWDTDTLGRLGALMTRLRAFVRGEGGSLVLEAAPAAATAGDDGIDPWGDVGTGFPVMRALKENLDPKGTLNPGRFVGRL